MFCRCRQTGSGRAILKICLQKGAYLTCRRTYRDTKCDRLGVEYSQQTLPKPRRRHTSGSTTRSLEHQLRLLNVRIRWGWTQRRQYLYIICRKTVVLESISRQFRPCTYTPREFHRTISLGRLQRISYGISCAKDRLMCVQPRWKLKTVH